MANQNLPDEYWKKLNDVITEAASHFQKNDRLMLGRESAGVPEYVHESVDDAVTIEMPGKGRSLNVVVSCMMVLSEALRQTRDL